ncbi:30S ribosomal protein S7 [bacterium]|nr:30S ribosomal protein S7 [bacterium]
MARRRRPERRPITPDHRYGDQVVTKFINYVMQDGKRSISERAIYNAFDIIKDKTGQEGIDVFRTALNNVKPSLEVKSRRIGGATYQVPVEVRPERRQMLAMHWVISFARSRPEHTFAERLAAELVLASKNEGPSIKKREDTHRMADANKAFAHCRW